MFKIMNAETKREVNTFIGLGTVISGNIQTQGCLNINGRVKGDLSVAGDLVIGDSAEVTGNVNANNVTIGGIFEGNIIAAGILKLLSTAKLNGDIDVGGIVAEDGGVFIGKCSLIKPPSKIVESVYFRKRNNEALSNKILVSE